MKKLMWIVSFIPLIVTGIILQFIPDWIPMHYNLNGEVDRWGSKIEQLIFPIAIISITLFWQLMIHHFEKKIKTAKTEKEIAESTSNGKVLCIVGISQAVMFGVMHFFLFYGTCETANSGLDHATVDIAKISCILGGIVFMVLGNFMPKAKKNGAVGVRVAWSMYNGNTWRKSNRFGSIALILAGLLTIATTVFVDGNVSTIMMIIYLILASVVTVIYAKKVFEHEKSLENQNRKRPGN